MNSSSATDSELVEHMLDRVAPVRESTQGKLTRGPGLETVWTGVERDLPELEKGLAH